MDNRVSLKDYETNIKDDDIKVEIKKAIQVVDLYTETKDQNWLFLRWKIWEEICRFCPIKTSQPYWPFGKLVYYNSKFVFGELDTWVAKYWFSLNGGTLWIDKSYLEKFQYKTYKEYKKSTSEKKKEVENETTEEKKELVEKVNFIHFKEFTEAKYSYLSMEVKKYAKERTYTKNTKRRKPFSL